MAQINLIFPILPGKKEAHAALLAQILGPRRAEFDERSRRCGVNWERGFYQETPAGTMFLLVVDADQPTEFIGKLMEAPTAFEQWFMGEAAAIHGLDPEAAKQMTPPDAMDEWHAPGHTVNNKPDAAFAVPVLKVEAWKAFHKDLLATHAEGFAAERARLGVTRETHFLHQTPMGAFTAIALEGKNLDGFGQKMANPESEFGRLFLEQVSELNGFTPEVGNHLVMPTLCYDYDRSKAPAATH